jgi:ABC-type nitrate/sulfonate/bicarbonate transport system substrate-binding protein
MTFDKLWYTRCPVPTAFSLALRLGWIDQEFAADGIEVVSLLNSPVRSVRESHFAHTQPNSFRHGGNIPPIWAHSQGHDVRLIALSWTDENQVVLTRPDSGIRSAAELKDRRLAVPRRLNDSIDFWRATVLRGYRAVLKTAGLDEHDVEFVEVPVDRAWLDDSPEGTARRGSLWGVASTRSFQREEAIALLTGKVDAIFSAHAHGADVKAFLGAQVITDLNQQGDRLLRINNCTPLALTASGSLVDQRPDLVARWLVNVINAANWAKTHRTETYRVVAAESGVAEETAYNAFGDSLPDQLLPDLADDKVAAIVSQKDFLLAHRFIKRDFDIERFIARDPLILAHQFIREREERGDAFPISEARFQLSAAGK